MHFGLNDCNYYTLKELDEKYWLTRKRIRQIECKSLRELQYLSKSNELSSCLQGICLMNINRAPFLKIAGITLTIILLGGIFFLRVMQNYEQQDYLNSNFFTFWLTGRMELTGDNPYDQTQYLEGHDAAGATWKPNQIFPYPLPLSLFMIPLGLLSLSNAYIAWQLASLVIIATTVLVVLSHWKEPAQRRLLVPMMVFLLFFGPEYRTLQIGSIGAFALIVVLISLLLFEKEKPILAGTVLSLTFLKPPQGLTILLLAVIWFLARKDWKAILGVAFGGLALLVIGMIQDPLWVVKFISASQAVMDRSQGIQSNVWGYSFLICKQKLPCSTILGGGGALTLLGLGSLFLWRNRTQLSVWDAFNVIIPIGFVSTIYLWSYDQILYIIPITWIVGTLVERKKRYIQAFIFMAVLILTSFISLVLQAYTLKNIWSLGNTVIVLGMVCWLLYLKQKKPLNDCSEVSNKRDTGEGRLTRK
jgi:Glycosyltransferase family 87